MQALISEVINERRLWMIITTRKENCEENEVEILKPMIENLNEQWFGKGDFVWTGRLDDDKTCMAIFEATEEKARNYFSQYQAVCKGILDTNLHQWDAFPLFSVLERMQGKI